MKNNEIILLKIQLKEILIYLGRFKNKKNRFISIF
jgi:hypothetical protein